jgi:hypothetical protein
MLSMSSAMTPGGDVEVPRLGRRSACDSSSRWHPGQCWRHRRTIELAFCTIQQRRSAHGTGRPAQRSGALPRKESTHNHAVDRVVMQTWLPHAKLDLGAWCVKVGGECDATPKNPREPSLANLRLALRQGWAAIRRRGQTKPRAE